MSRVSIRDAMKSDCALILTMIKELAAYHREPNGVVITEDVLLKDGFCENPWFYCLIAEVTEGESMKPAGFILFHKAYSTWKGKAYHIEDFYVRATHRRQGVGMELLKGVARRALEENSEKIMWSALDWNESAHDFYIKCGAEKAEEWKSFIFGRKAMEKLLQQ